jgi:hypothetical protein
MDFLDFEFVAGCDRDVARLLHRGKLSGIQRLGLVRRRKICSKWIISLKNKHLARLWATHSPSDAASPERQSEDDPTIDLAFDGRDMVLDDDLGRFRG